MSKNSQGIILRTDGFSFADGM